MNDILLVALVLPGMLLVGMLVEHVKAWLAWGAGVVRDKAEWELAKRKQARFDRKLDAWRDERRRPAARHEWGAAGRAPYPPPPRVKADTTGNGEATR